MLCTCRPFTRPLFAAATLQQAITFVHKPQESYDFCRESCSVLEQVRTSVDVRGLAGNPSLLPLHGTFSRDLAQSPKLLPQFVLSKFEQSPQILMTPLEAFQNVTLRVPWEEKTAEKVSTIVSP